jgi:hypothetical protein
MADAYELPPHVKPRFDPANPPADIARDPRHWDYWAVEPSGDVFADFNLGDAIGRECLQDDDRETMRPMLAYVLATMRDKGQWGDVEAGLISLLGRKAHYGARPTDFEDATPSELTGVQRTEFQLGMADAIADMEWAATNPLYRLLPARIMSRIARAVTNKERSPEFAGYVTAIISAATACGEH